jgi:hypothetical protein
VSGAAVRIELRRCGVTTGTGVEDWSSRMAITSATDPSSGLRGAFAKPSSTDLETGTGVWEGGFVPAVEAEVIPLADEAAVVSALEAALSLL